MREVEIDQFADAHADGATVIDVREPMEYVSGHVPGAVLIPMGQLPARVGEVPNDGPVYVVCASGNRSHAVAEFLVHQGYDAVNVSGGTQAWVRSGRPVSTGRDA